MFDRLVLFAALVSASGNSLLDGPPKQILAFVGEHVFLPCRFDATPEIIIDRVEWSKQGLDPNVVFLYRGDREVYAMKNPGFHYRTSITLHELHKGNISLMIFNLTQSDSGNYTCKKRFGDIRFSETVELFVDSQPKQSVLPAENGGVTVVCEALSWLTESEIQIQNDQGTNVCNEVQRSREISNAPFNISCQVTVKPDTIRSSPTEMKCVFRQAVTDQIRTTKICLPAFRHEKDEKRTEELKGQDQCLMWKVFVGILTGLLFSVIGLLVYVQFFKYGPQKQDKTCDQKKTLLKNKDNHDNATLEQERRKNEELKAELSIRKQTISHQEETINQQKQTINQQKQTISQRDQTINQQKETINQRDALKAKLTTTYKHDQPVLPPQISLSMTEPRQGRDSWNTHNVKFLLDIVPPPKNAQPNSNHPKVREQSDMLPQYKRHMSCPAFSPSDPSGEASGKTQTHIPRSMSYSLPRPTAKISPRSHSFSLPPPIPTSNRYSTLAESNDE